MDLLDFKKGHKYVAQLNMTDGSSRVFTWNDQYECLQAPTSQGTKIIVLMQCDLAQPSYEIERYWAQYFEPVAEAAIEIKLVDPDGELYDAYVAGRVTKEMLDSYKLRHGKPHPAYMS